MHCQAAKFEWDDVQKRISDEYHHENMPLNRRNDLFQAGFIHDVKGRVVAQIIGTYRVGKDDIYDDDAGDEQAELDGKRNTRSAQARSVRGVRAAMASGNKGNLMPGPKTKRQRRSSDAPGWVTHQLTTARVAPAESAGVAEGGPPTRRKRHSVTSRKTGRGKTGRGKTGRGKTGRGKTGRAKSRGSTT